jgi:hypothetical protein
MYTNIDTTTGLNTIKEFLTLNKLPFNFPTQLFLQVLEAVMQNNIFSFGTTFWLQLSGTAMGTHAACTYAILTYGHYENSTLLPAFDNNFIYYRHYIDDVLGIWIPPTNGSTSKWLDFKNKLNNCGKLQWEINNPVDRVIFLDLNLSIRDSKLAITTFQKQLNLYLYLPPLSAHPVSCLKGFIKGELNRYCVRLDTKLHLGQTSASLNFISQTSASRGLNNVFDGINSFFLS